MRRLRPFASVVTLASLVACGGSGSAPKSAPPPPPPAPVAASSTPPAAPAMAKPAYPATPRRPVTDTYGAIAVTDDYQWLENGDAPEVKAWSHAQNAFARAYLDASPERAELHARVEQALRGTSSTYAQLTPRAGLVFALKEQPPKQQPMLVVLRSLDDVKTERVLVDPNAIDPSGKTAIDIFAPSADGKLLAVTLSKGGTESGDLHVFDVATGKERPDVVPHVNGGTAGGAVTWKKDGSGFYYTRYPKAGERPPEDLDFYVQIYFHKLGTPIDKDVYALGKDAPRIAEWKLQTSDDGAYVLATMDYGDGGERDLFLLGRPGAGGAWQRIAEKSDRIRAAEFGRDGKLYLVSRAGAPRGKVLRIDPARPSIAAAEEIVPESAAVIEAIAPTKTRLYVVDMVGGPSQLRVVPLTSSAAGAKGPPAAAVIATRPVSSIGEIHDIGGDDVVFSNQSYTEPLAFFRVRASGAVEKTALAETSSVDFADVEVVRETCASKDGTQVPMSILRKKGITLDGSHPALLNAYGGFDISRLPRFIPKTRVWIDQGGVWVDANLRGGGEMGEEWHRAGSLTHKQNVFDDFAACAEALVQKGYTRPAKLAIEGRSNGGLLMGAALTQHPELYRAVVAQVGIYDSLRSELSPNGVFIATEYGSVKNPAQLQALYAYSPYHHVTDGTAYPAVLFMTGENDPRVSPWHSRKMVARLQAATSSPNPILLRTSDDTGHLGTPLGARIDEVTDEMVFLVRELGLAKAP